jgi:hypothetical protein
MAYRGDFAVCQQGSGTESLACSPEGDSSFYRARGIDLGEKKIQEEG